MSADSQQTFPPSVQIVGNVGQNDSGQRRQILPPEEVDSLGKLNEWLAENGMPQRDCLRAEIGNSACAEAEKWGLGVRFYATDRDAANVAYRTLIKWVAGAFYARMSNMGGQQLVWRVRPQLDEENIFHYLRSDGSAGDPITDRQGDLTMVDTGERAVKFYARFWLEPEKVAA